MYRTVIFDLDGTLLNTIEDLADAANWVCRRNGWPEHDLQSIQDMVGHGITNLVEQFSPKEFRSPLMVMNTVSQFTAYYGAHNMEKTTPYPGVGEMLHALQKQGVTMAVYSNKADEFSRAMVEHYFPGVFRLVRGKLCGMPVKPDPMGVRTVLRMLGAVPEQTLFVGDSGVDVETAHNGNVTACGVTWGFRSREELLEAGADQLVDTAQDLTDYILKTNP